MTGAAEGRREALENAMAHLAAVCALLELTSFRAGQVRERAPALLGPAMDELGEAQDRIGKARTELVMLWEGAIWNG